MIILSKPPEFDDEGPKLVALNPLHIVSITEQGTGAEVVDSNGMPHIVREPASEITEMVFDALCPVDLDDQVFEPNEAD